MDSTSHWEICLHEAGHAAVAVALGIAVERIEVHDEGGRCLLRDDPGEAAVVIAVAGSAAIEVFLGEIPAGVCADDDEQKAAKWATSPRQITFARAEARSIVRQNWGAIEYLARALLAEKTISGRRLVAAD